MEIITRKEARERGLSKYFTGEPCKNGHHNYRYTQSGTCVDCVRVANLHPPVSLERKETLEKLTIKKFRCYDSDREILSETICAVTMARFPQLSAQDIDRRLAPGPFEGGTRLHRFYVYHEDIPTLLDIAASMISAHSVAPDIAATQAAVARMIDAETPLPPPWKP